MAVTPLEHPDTDPVSSLLTRAVELHDLAAQVERDKLIAVAAFADAHTAGALMADLYGTYSAPDQDAYDRVEGAWVERFGMIGADRMLDLAGPGAPKVSEFAVIELAAALGKTTDSGRLLVGDVMEAKHRLPKVWARLEAGQVEAWRVRRLAQHTRPLAEDVVGFVDAHVASVVHTAGPITIARLVTEAIARFDPEACEVHETDANAGLHLDLDLAGRGRSIAGNGAVGIEGSLDRADAEELEAVVAHLAEQLRRAQEAAGDPIDTLAVRRAKAMGYLARGETPVLPDQHDSDQHSNSTGPVGRQPRRVVLHVHLSQAALAGTPEIDPISGRLGIHLARVENHRQTVTADAVRDWCGVPGTQVVVKPVIDLHDTVAVDAYEVPDRIAERVRLQRPTCVFPFCTRPARASEGNADLDHTVEYSDTGPPGQTSTENLAPKCRTHHRAKTHPSPAGMPWRYQRLTAGTWLWTSPMGRRYLVHPDGTTAL